MPHRKGLMLFLPTALTLRWATPKQGKEVRHGTTVSNKRKSICAQFKKTKRSDDLAITKIRVFLNPIQLKIHR